MRAVLTLISLPLLVALVQAGSFHLANRNSGVLASSGESREFLLHVPESYDSARPMALVVSLHGGAGWPVLHRDMTNWSRLAESEGFIVVYPAGIGVGGIAGWSAARSGPSLEQDVRFISDLMDALERDYNIDPTRIYVDGLSNGAGMAYVLSCTLSDRIAAVGMVAAAHMLPSSWCAEQSPEGQRPVPMISFHGTADSIIPYRGGTSWAGPGSFPDIPEWTADWAGRNGCDPDPVESAVAGDVTKLAYSDCIDDAAVRLFTIEGGGHTWPGSKPQLEWFLGPTALSVDATRRMWRFFQEHRLQGDSL